jgi:hypothetical protein
MLDIETLLAPRPEAVRGLTQELRALVREAVPQTIEEVKTGWQCVALYVPVGPGRRSYYGFIIPHDDRVTFGFPNGLALRDGPQMLGADEKLVRTRYVYVRGPREVRRAVFKRWAREAADLALMPRPLRDELLARAKAPR